VVHHLKGCVQVVHNQVVYLHKECVQVVHPHRVCALQVDNLQAEDLLQEIRVIYSVTHSESEIVYSFL
jgi:hypothetical protein